VLSIEELERVIEIAQRLAGPGEELVGVLPTEPSTGTMIYLCAFGIACDADPEAVPASPARPSNAGSRSSARSSATPAVDRGVAGDQRTWLALDAAGEAVESRAVVRDAVSIAALCEVAEETAAGGDLDDLRSRLVALRLTENPPGVDEAEEAVLALQRTIGAPPPGAASRRPPLRDGQARRYAAARRGSWRRRLAAKARHRSPRP